jgi:AraC family transcriptional regulator, transcriptional activator of pobA
MSGRLDVDRLDAGAVVEVLRVDGLRIGDGALRTPHRHDYHELIWVRDGEGLHLVDDALVPVEPGTVTVIGRGQVHQFRHAAGVHGAVIRFTDEALHGADGTVAAGWLLAGRDGRTIAVPPGDHDHVDALVAALADEATRPPDRYTADAERHLVSTLLLWLERWYDASRRERRDAGDADVELHRRFTERLERDFAHHHDAGHYADALAIPPAALSKALARLTGRPTKELVTDRVMLEARRLLRHTDLSVGEVAFHAGFTDPFYFSRAFKRHTGRAPQAFRESARGREVHP